MTIVLDSCLMVAGTEANREKKLEQGQGYDGQSGQGYNQGSGYGGQSGQGQGYGQSGHSGNTGGVASYIPGNA